MRIAVAEVVQETDTFSPIIADLGDFEKYGLFYGPEILERMRGVGPIGGLLEVTAEQPGPVGLVPIVRAWAGAGGTITPATLEFLTDKLVSGLKKVLPVDAVFLALHGAAASNHEDDVEGHLLQAVRGVVGAGVPIVVPFDHHANITTRMFECADLLVGHETQPHDTVSTGRKAARLLFDILAGKIQPTRAWQKIPMITPQDQFLTSQGPMQEWFNLARAMEQRPGVLDVSPYPMQPWLDVAEGGWAVVAHTDNDPALARSLAAESAALAWKLREKFWASERLAPADAIRTAIAAPAGLIILSDTGDSVYGGAPGDSTCILAALLEQPAECLALLPMVDPESLAAMFAAGVGAEITLDLGGKQDHVFSQPVRVTGRVAALCTGLTALLDAHGECDLGRTGLLEVGNVRVVVMHERNFAINHPILYTHLGLEIAAAKMVVVKTASNFQFFQRWRQGLIRVDAPGTTQSDLTAFEWKRVPRPMYPLDELPAWEPALL